jgi:peptide/nickel transport system ATP-binding protein
LDFALSVNNLRVYYFSQVGTVKAVDDVSFSVGKNESIGIVGESGCGKSTLGTALLRSVPHPGRIVSGQIMLGGKNITRMAEEEFDNKVRWKKISMIFQGALNTLDPVFTIGSQMKEILKQHGYSKDQSETIQNSLKLKKDRNMSIVFISHDLGVISEVSEIIAIMYRGQIVELGKAHEVYKNPKHPYTEKLVSSIPSIKNRENKLQNPSEKSADTPGCEAGCKFYDACPYAKETCRKDPPVINHKNGFVRCWLFE